MEHIGGGMGLFSSLFAGKPPKADAVSLAKRRAPEFGEIDVEGRREFLQHIRSPNGRFILGWLDANPEGNRGGFRESGKGKYVLLEGTRLRARGYMERPNDGKVADNGTFVLNDWLFGSGLNGDFYAFRVDGSPILKRHFNANLLNNGLAPNGSLAVCQTCNSPDKADNSVLAIFDLVEGRELTRVNPEPGWADQYEFPLYSKTVGLRLRDPLGTFFYSCSGEFIDRQRWIMESLATGQLNLVKRLMEEAVSTAQTADYRRWLDAVESGLKHPQYRERSGQALGFRLKGQCLDALGRPIEALEAFDKALKHDPKIGVKRRAEQLRKAIGNTSK